MRNYLALMLMAGACCLVFSREARADVVTITDVSYYEPTNSIRAWAATSADYDTLAYYDVSHWGQVNKDDTALTMFWATNYGYDAYNEEYFPYDPSADFTIEAYAQAIARVRHDYGDTYEDYYNYVQWTNAAYGDPVYYPYYFGFAGPGPDVQIQGSSILLGGVFSLFTEGATAGPPDHVRVVSDSGQELHDFCQSFPVREMVLQVVDFWGRRVSRLGRIPIKEQFYDTSPGNPEIGSVYSSCTNSSITPSPCQLWDLGGKFPDTMRPGCNGNSQRPCGLPEFFNSWIWCPRGEHEKPLAWTRRNISSEEILVNSRPRYNPGDELR